MNVPEYNPVVRPRHTAASTHEGYVRGCPDCHTCSPSIGDYESKRPTCVECKRQLVRIAHSPGHHLFGYSCGFPERWAYCFIPEDRVLAAAADPLVIPEWRLG